MTSALARKINTFAILGICLPLLGAYGIQFFAGDLPCPLCLLQRAGMLGVAFGAMLNLRFGIKPAHYGVSIISALFGAAVSVRQILLHIVPGTGAYGAPVMGLHLYTWALVVFVISIFMCGVMLFFSGQFSQAAEKNTVTGMTLFEKFAFFAVVAIAAANVITTFLMCGLGPCDDDPVNYKLLSGLFN